MAGITISRDPPPNKKNLLKFCYKMLSLIENQVSDY
jgi:hypothetical protein